MTIEPHEIALQFPQMKEADFKNFVESIRNVGLIHEIILYDGKILDGHHRYRACIEAGIEPRFSTYEGSNPLGFACAQNLERRQLNGKEQVSLRRHLTDTERAIVAAKMANFARGGDRTKRSFGRLNKITEKQAAEQANVSPTAVKRARAVQKKGIPELNTALADGKITLTVAADIAQRSADEQRTLLNGASRQTRHGPTTLKQKRLQQFMSDEKFLDTVGIILATSERAQNLELPALSAKQVNSAVKDLAEARRAIGRLLNKLRELQQ